MNHTYDGNDRRCDRLTTKTRMPYSNWPILSLIFTIFGSNLKAVAIPNNTFNREISVKDTTEISQLSVPSPQLPVPKPPEQPIPPLLPPPEELLQIPPTPETPEQLPNNETKVTVFRYEIVGSNIFSFAQIAEVTQQYTGESITFAQMLKAEDAVNELLRKNGYINSGAIILPQKIENGIVKIQIVGGELEAIRVRGTRRLNANYIRSRLAIASGKPFNSRRLLRALQLLQLNPLIETLSAKITAGSRRELSLLEVEVKEENSFNLELFVDNGRIPSVGSFRRGIRIGEGNLFGLGDNLNISYNNTDGSNALDLSYTLPLNPRNGTLSLAYGMTASNVIEPPFDRVDITGNSRYYEFTFRQPVYQLSTKEIALGVTASRQESETTLLGEKFPLSVGADGEGRTHISAFRFFQEYTQRNPRSVFAARSQFSLGIGALNATIHEEPPDSRFLAWRGQVQYVRLLAPETLLVLRSDAQLANRTLLPLEQFGLGGIRSVRGYRQDVLLADNGVLTSAEIRIPIYRTLQPRKVLQVIPFIDFAKAWNSSGRENPDTNTLLGVGLGLQLQLENNFIARFDYGIPFIEVDGGNRTWQEKGFYFTVEYNLF